MCEGLKVGWLEGAIVGFDVSCVEGCIDKVYEDGRDKKTFNSGIFVDSDMTTGSLPCLSVG